MEARTESRKNRRNILKHTGQFALDLLFPRCCNWCGALIGFANRCHCHAALQTAHRANLLPVPREGHAFSHLQSVYAPFSYVFPARNAILQMKFYGELWSLPHYVHAMSEAIPITHFHPPISVIMPVPSTQNERRARENIPNLLAAELGRLLSLPVCTKTLQKIRETPRQVSLTGKERRENLHDAFSLSDDAIPLQEIHVLLVDDVVTTGSTLNECAKALVHGGAICSAVCIATADGMTPNMRI